MRRRASAPVATGTSTLGVGADVADGIVFLPSGASSYITGRVLDINGGLGMFY